MTPQLVDHAHTDSCIVIGCNLVQPRREINMLLLIAVTSYFASQSQSHYCEHEIARFARLSQSQSHHSRNCEQRLTITRPECWQ